MLNFTYIPKKIEDLINSKAYKELKTIGERLKFLRISSGYPFNNKRFQSKVFMSWDTIRHHENNRRNVKLNQLKTYCRFYNVQSIDILKF